MSESSVGHYGAPVEARAPHLAEAIQKVADQGFEFYVVSSEAVREHLNLTPYGQPVTWLDFSRAVQYGWSTHEFLDQFHVMNGIAFGPRGIPMPRWVMIDLALMPSAALITAMPQDAYEVMVHTAALGVVAPRLIEVLESARKNGYTGPIPVGGYCACPSAAPGRWVGWSLWSVVPGVGLGLAAKALALSVYRARQLDGVTQYDNAAIRVHARFGRLRVVAATVPLHTAAGSFRYENDLTQPAGEELRSPTFLLDPADLARQQAMQSSIEAQEADYFILPPGLVVDSGRTVVPVLRVPR